MLFIKRINFSEGEAKQILKDFDGYIWIALDVKKGMMAAGDEFAGTLKYVLLKNKCRIQDIFGVGFDLVTGEIDYISPINIKLMERGSTKEVPADKRERIETLVRYFFSELPVLRKEKRKPRYSRKP